MIKMSNGTIAYKNCVIGETEHYWLDGMLEVNANVYDSERNKIISVQVGYYGSDGANLCACNWDVDVDTENLRKAYSSERSNAIIACAKSIEAKRYAIEKGAICEVVKGRKVKKGTIITVFWSGEKPTYSAQRYSWIHDTELIAGGYTESGEKVFIKAEYLKRLNPYKMPNRKERKKYIQRYILDVLKANGCQYAKAILRA